MVLTAIRVLCRCSFITWSKLHEHWLHMASPAQDAVSGIFWCSFCCWFFRTKGGSGSERLFRSPSKQRCIIKPGCQWWGYFNTRQAVTGRPLRPPDMTHGQRGICSSHVDDCIFVPTRRWQPWLEASRIHVVRSNLFILNVKILLSLK